MLAEGSIARFNEIFETLATFKCVHECGGFGSSQSPKLGRAHDGFEVRFAWYCGVEKVASLAREEARISSGHISRIAVLLNSSWREFSEEQTRILWTERDCEKISYH
jgi:hypothetical protein